MRSDRHVRSCHHRAGRPGAGPHSRFLGARPAGKARVRAAHPQQARSAPPAGRHPAGAGADHRGAAAGGPAPQPPGRADRHAAAGTGDHRGAGPAGGDRAAEGGAGQEAGRGARREPLPDRGRAAGRAVGASGIPLPGRRAAARGQAPAGAGQAGLAGAEPLLSAARRERQPGAGDERPAGPGVAGGGAAPVRPAAAAGPGPEPRHRAGDPRLGHSGERRPVRAGRRQDRQRDPARRDRAQSISSR